MAFSKPLDVEDFHIEATDSWEGKLGCTLKSQTHSPQAKYTWLANAAHREAEIHLEQRSEVDPTSNSFLFHFCFGTCQYPTLLQRTLTTRSG